MMKMIAGSDSMLSVSSVTLAMTATLLISINASLKVDAGKGSKLCVGESHTCFVNYMKELKCWGSNIYGQAGIKDLTFIGDEIGEMEQLKPYAYDVEEVTCGSQFTCFRKTNNKVYCHGSNQMGELGRTTTSYKEFYDEASSLVPLPAAKEDIKIASGKSFSCAVVDISIYCWGYSKTINYGSTPVEILRQRPVRIISITVGAEHACYLDEGNSAYCWGRNKYGELGLGSTAASVSMPTDILLYPVSSISAGYDHTCVTLYGDVKNICFGNNNNFQLGDLTLKDKGRYTSDLIGMLAKNYLPNGNIFAGKEGTCIISANDQRIYCIGGNDGNLICAARDIAPIGGSPSHYAPNYKMNIPLNYVSELALGYGNHHCATNGEQVYCWGSNFDGQLGIGTSFSSKYCTPDDNLVKACIDGTCDYQNQPCNGHQCSYLEDPFFLFVIVLGYIGVCTVIVTTFAWRKRMQFDNMKFQHPSGATITGVQIWESYTNPIGPMTALPYEPQLEHQPSFEMASINPPQQAKQKYDSGEIAVI